MTGLSPFVRFDFLFVGCDNLNLTFSQEFERMPSNNTT
jgi:hypothetical protein